MTDERRKRYEAESNKNIDALYGKEGRDEDAETIKKLKEDAMDWYDNRNDPQYKEDIRRKLKDQGENV